MSLSAPTPEADDHDHVEQLLQRGDTVPVSHSQDVQRQRSQSGALTSAVVPRGPSAALRSDGRTVTGNPELAVVRGEWDRYWAKLRETEAERDHLRAGLRDALEQLEHWRTLAEYREMMLARQRDTTDRRYQPPSMGYPLSEQGQIDGRR